MTTSNLSYPQTVSVIADMNADGKLDEIRATFDVSTRDPINVTVIDSSGSKKDVTEDLEYAGDGMYQLQGDVPLNVMSAHAGMLDGAEDTISFAALFYGTEYNMDPNDNSSHFWDDAGMEVFILRDRETPHGEISSQDVMEVNYSCGTVTRR